MNKIKFTFLLSFIFTLIIQGYTSKINNELSQNVVRLHISANSDSNFDQSVKRQVRDKILDEISLSDKNFVEKSQDIANNMVNKYGYGAKSEYGKFYFPSKKYDNLSLPAGKYFGIRVVLGEGRGENWWCVLYPPMCVKNENLSISSNSKAKLVDSISKDAYEIISEKGDEVIVKFKIVEMYNKIVNLFDN